MEHLRQLLNLFFKVLKDISEMKMMNQHINFFSVMILGVILGFTSCNDDDTLRGAGSANVSFSDETYRTLESADSIIVPIGLDSPYHSEGSVEISITNAIYGVDYTTDRDTSVFTLDFAEDEVHKEFQIKPIDNSVLNTDTELEIRITKTTGGIEVGKIPFLQVIFQDDEERMSAEVSFDTINFEVTESDILDVDLAFSNISTDGGSITVVAGAGDAIYGEDYVIEEANDDGEITLNVDQYGDAASLKIIALDNDQFEEEKTFKLQILEVTGGLSIGENSIAEVTIQEDDASPFASLGFDPDNADMAAENSDKVTINFDLSQPAAANQTFEINYSSASTANLGEDFNYFNGDISNPFIVELEEGATSASITLELLDDEEEEGDETIILNLANASGDLQIDPNNSTFTFTIQDDETETSGGTAYSYLETFESAEDLSEPQLSDFGYVSEVSSATTVAMPESSSISLNYAQGKFLDADDVNATSDWGIQMGYVNKTTDGTSSGSIDNVVISPELGADDGSSYSFTYDASYSKPNSSAVVELYYSTDSDGSSFNNGNWTLAESFTEATMDADRNAFDRRMVTFPVSGKFHVAIRITAEIGDADTSDDGTRWRFDNIRITGN